jgi:ubiquinone/menaquinone biosynthesis C-methylase UbiE
MKKVLHVGCGAATIEKMPKGFKDGSWEEVRFDINPAVRPDVLGTITDMSAVQTNSVDAVYSSHNIEHVYSHEVSAVLGEFRRVIKEDGFAVITCPDLKAVAEKIVEAGLAEPLYHSPAGPIAPLDILYGHIAAVARGETYMAHRTGFTAETLMAQLNKAGFAMIGIARRPAHFDLWALATKKPASEEAVRDLMRNFTGI